MKFVCGFIGWIVGMFLCFMVMNSVPFLGFVFILGGIPLGRYIGGCIEEDREISGVQEKIMSAKENKKNIIVKGNFKKRLKHNR